MSDPEYSSSDIQEKPDQNQEQSKEHSGHHLPFHHHHHRSHHLLHLIHPSGKHVHVVHQPSEVDPKRRELQKDGKGAFDENYDVVIYGSPDHVCTVRDVHNHNLSRRDALRAKNTELFQEFDDVHETLDHLSDELNRLTDHAVALDASFNKFGYAAHIRTKDDVESSSLHSGNGGDGNNSAGERHKDRSLEPIKFFKTPSVRQYFHKGLLWRSPKSGEVGSFELFTDLIYVGVIDYIGEVAVTHASAESFLHFCILFSLGYKIWSDLTVTVNWFEIEDVTGRVLILFILCCLYGFNSNIEYFFEYTYTAGISFYLTQRVFFVTIYALYSTVIPMIRGTLLSHALIGLVSSALYIGSIHVEYPNRLILLFLAMFVELAGGMMLVVIIKYIRDRRRCSSTCSELSKWFDFVPAINIEHRVERTSAFTTLVFGYSILKSLYQSHAHIGVNAFLGKGMLAVIQAFTIMWIYFDIDAFAIHVHAIRRHWLTASIWIVSHLFLSGAFILAASTLSDLVLAHDCEHSEVEDLAESYVGRSVGELEKPQRWFYCGGLAVTLLFMNIIAYCHVHKKVQRHRVTKTIRLIIRLCVCVILVCLPLAHELNSLELIAITSSLFVFVLVMDIFGNSCPGERFFTGGLGNCPETRAQYTAKVKIGRKKRTELEKRLANGENVGLEDALNLTRTGSMSSQTTLDVNEEWHGGHM